MKELEYIDLKNDYYFVSKLSFNQKCLIVNNLSREYLDKYYNKNCEFLDNSKSFLSESLFELLMRTPDGNGAFNYSFEPKLIANRALQTLYESQNNIVHSVDIEDSFSIFSLWQFNNQENMFVVFYRYFYFFNFENQNINLKERFIQKFGFNYNRIFKFCIFTLTTFIINKVEEYMTKIIESYHDVLVKLSINRNRYRELSIGVCKNINDIAFSLKTSYTFPFIFFNNRYYLPLPHILPTSCSKSLLYRITDMNDKDRNLIGKNVFEEYLFHLLSISKNNGKVYKEIEYQIGKNNYKTPDVLCIGESFLIGIDAKLLTPSAQFRVFNKKAFDKQKKEILKAIDEVYNAMFINYINQSPFSKIDNEKRYGIIVTLERFDFSRHKLFRDYCISRNFDEEKYNFISKHIKILAVYDVEDLVFRGGSIIDEIKFMNENGKVWDFDFPKVSLSKKYTNKEFINFQQKVTSIDFLK